MSGMMVKPASFDTAMMAMKNTSAPPSKTAEAAKEFEAVYVSQMLSHMFEGLDPDPMFGGGPGEEMFRGFMTQEYGKMIAHGPGIGISDQIQKMMIQMQQKADGGIT